MADTNGVGRPTKLDKHTLKKLEEAFGIGASDTEACFYADITPTTLYNYQKENPEFLQRKAALKERPVLLARQSLARGIEKDPNLAFKYLERKRRREFGPNPGPPAPPANPIVFVNNVPAPNDQA